MAYAGGYRYSRCYRRHVYADTRADLQAQHPLLHQFYGQNAAGAGLVAVARGSYSLLPYLITYRPVSQYIADKFSVWHESPQVLLISKGECIYDASHLDITVAELAAELQATNS